MLNPDYSDMLSVLSAANVEFLVVGAFALAAHGNPRRIDLLTGLEGIENFDEAWSDRLMIKMEELQFPVLGRATLIRNKRALGRPQDVADVAWLEKHTQ